MSDKEGISITIRRIELEDVWFEGLGPLDVKLLGHEVERRIEKISKDRNTVDTLKVLLHTALYYAAQAHMKTAGAGAKNKDEARQLESAIEKLNHALSSLPLK